MVDEGKNALGFGHDWFRSPPVLRQTSADWTALLLQPEEEMGPEAGVEAGSAAAESFQAARPLVVPREAVGMEEFVEMLQSQVLHKLLPCPLLQISSSNLPFKSLHLPERATPASFPQVVCIWGECHLISSRKRQQKLVDDEVERARNPPWYSRAWSMVSGGGVSTSPETADHK